VALRDRRSLAYTVMATSWQRLGTGALATYIATAPERTAEAREQLDRELARYAERLVDRTTVDRAIHYLVGQWIVGRQRGAAVAAELADAWLAGDPVEAVTETPERYRAVTAKAVRAVCGAAFARPAVVGMVKGTGG